MDLQKFCSRDETRPSIMHPFRQGGDGYVYATDGRILVRAKVDGYYPEQGKPKIVGNGFLFDHDEVPPEDWVTVPGAMAADYCRSCGGGGRTKYRCEDCGDEHECIPCEKCHGTGLIFDPQAVPVGGAHFAAHYLALISRELPGPS